MPPKKCVTPFQEPHALEYGLEVSSRNPAMSDATLVMYMFCNLFGFEENLWKKWNNTSITKSFKVPFRSAYQGGVQHLEGQYPAKWAEYQVLSEAENETFFAGATLSVKLFQAQFFGSIYCIFLDIDVAIFDTTIYKLLLDTGAEGGIIERALSIFETMCPSHGKYMTH